MFEALEDRSLLAASSLTLATPLDETSLVEPGIASYSSDQGIAAMSAADAIRQNPLNRLDVNGDSFVSPIDALLVIDRLNAIAGVSDSPQDAVAAVYLDTSGDGFLTSIDALLVLNSLNGFTQPEAEQTAISPSYRLDFGSRSSALKSGMLRVTPNDTFGTSRSFGFVSATSRDLTAKSRDGYWGDHSRDFVQGTAIEFALRVTPNAIYHLEIGFGDPLQARSQRVSIEGVAEQQLDIPAGKLDTAEYDVQVSADGILNLVIRPTSSQRALINYLLTWAVPQNVTDNNCGTNVPQQRPDWMNVFPASQAPTFHPEQYPITCSQQFLTGTDWSGLNERQVFAERVAVKGPSQVPQYEFRLGKGSQLYSLRFRDNAGRWREAVATQGSPATGTVRNAEWVDEVLQTIIVDTELNDRSQESTKNQIHQSGTYHNIQGVPTFYSPVLDQAWLPSDRTLATVAWPQQAHIPSNFQSHFLLLQQIRDLGSGVLEVTYVYHNFSQEGEKATFLASPWLPIRHSTFPYQYRSLPNGQLQRDQRDWCIESGCNSTPEAIRNSDGYFLFSSGPDANSNALAIVYGVDANSEGQTGATRFRWGTDRTPTRDLTAASVQKLVRIDPGQVFYHRFFLVLNSLQNSRSIAQQLKPYVNQGFLTTDNEAPADALLTWTNGKLTVSNPSQVCDTGGLPSGVPLDTTPPVTGASQLDSCIQGRTLGMISTTARSGWQPLMMVVQRSTGRRIATNDPYWLVAQHDWSNYAFDDILGWISPTTAAALASDPDPDLAGLFVLSPYGSPVSSASASKRVDPLPGTPSLRSGSAPRGHCRIHCCAVPTVTQRRLRVASVAAAPAHWAAASSTHLPLAAAGTTSVTS